MIPNYPESIEPELGLRPWLHPVFQGLEEGISEFTFANIYLFRRTHAYRISRLDGGEILIQGVDDGIPFFMLPRDLPDEGTLRLLFERFGAMKCVAASQVDRLRAQGYHLVEDRDNFDYLYRRNDLVELTGRKFHKKRNLIKAFVGTYNYEGRPLLEQYKDDALAILHQWRRARSDAGDYDAAREALELSEELQLCGGIYYVEGEPVAYSLGEELMRGTSFAVHFEKAAGDYKGIWQFVNQAFASILPEQYRTVNREQDLGDEGLRQAKLSYRPVDFVKKWRAMLAK